MVGSALERLVLVFLAALLWAGPARTDVAPHPADSLSPEARTALLNPGYFTPLSAGQRKALIDEITELWRQLVLGIAEQALGGEARVSAHALLEGNRIVFDADAVSRQKVRIPRTPPPERSESMRRLQRHLGRIRSAPPDPWGPPGDRQEPAQAVHLRIDHGAGLEGMFGTGSASWLETHAGAQELTSFHGYQAARKPADHTDRFSWGGDGHSITVYQRSEEQAPDARPLAEAVYGAAQAHGFYGFPGALVGEVEVEQGGLEVVVLGGDRQGDVVQDGDVVLLVTDFERPESLGLEVMGRPAGLEAGESYGVDFELAHFHRGLMRVEGPGVEATADGYRLETTEAVVRPRLSFDAEALRAYREGFPEGPAVVIGMRVRVGEESKRFFVQLSPWELMITRLEVRQKGAESARRHSTRGRQRRAEDYRFNDYTEIQGKLWDSWNLTLRQMVATRPRAEVAGQGQAFGPDEPVVMGWAVDKETGHRFVTAEDDPSAEREAVPGYHSGAHLVVEFDLDIVQDPTARTVRRPSDDEWDLDEDVYVNNEDEQWRLWQQFEVEAFEITVHEVDVSDEPDIRAQAGPALWGPMATLRGGHQKISDYVNLNPEHDITAPEYSLGKLHKPGIYEVALTMTVRRPADGSQRSVDVAVRIPVLAPGTLEVRTLQFNTQRGTLQ